jgi:hypothetical protein
MSAKVFFYCLKVWLASVLTGPLLFWCCLLIQDRNGEVLFSDFLLYWAFSIVVGLGCSLLSFLLFWGSTFFLYHQHWTVLRLRIVTAGLALVLTVVPFMVCFRSFGFFERERVVLFECYLLPILLGIFFYRYPRATSPSA